MSFLYTYDELYRLTKEVISDGSGSITNEYTYDKVSNRTSKKTTVTGDVTGLADEIVAGKITYSYNSFNQLISEKTSDGETITYTYDANGNLIEKRGNQVTNYTYDSMNRLVRATIQEGNSVTTEKYGYDAAGNRIYKETNEEGRVYYVLDTISSLPYVMAQINPDGSKNVYTYGDGIISLETSGKMYYYVLDGHGSVRKLVDDKGAVTDSYDYDAYGNLLKKTGEAPNDLLYTGEQYNETTGLYYLRARYMDPSTGMFISMDTYPGSTYDPVSLHRYLYANANPVMYTDPTGYFSLADISVSNSIKNILNSARATINVGKVMKWADNICTIYDVAMQVRAVLAGEGSIEDMAVALIRGMAVNYMMDGMCKAGLDFIIKPLMAAFGAISQVDRIKAAIESGDPVELTVAVTELVTIAFGLTRQCFTGETLVATEDGHKAIKDIKVGDYVYSCDTETGEVSLKKVTNVFVSDKDELYHVHTSTGETINTTEGHPFYVKGKGFVVAAELEAGDVLVTSDGKEVRVKAVTTTKLDEPVKVYNLEVEGNHTYYVTADEVLVHNMCKVADGAEIKRSGDVESCSTSTTSKPVYKPSPKHDPMSGWGSPNPIPDIETGQNLLDTAYSSSKNKQLYNIYDDQLIKFQPDTVDGWHSYLVANPAKEVPIDVLRKMMEDNRISKVQYKDFLKNNKR